MARGQGGKRAKGQGGKPFIAVARNEAKQSNRVINFRGEFVLQSEMKNFCCSKRENVIYRNRVFGIETEFFPKTQFLLCMMK
jgi:hypothetical protein